MEKIAIRIENYKNIKNQTFCFNPEFNCKFDKEKKEFNFFKKEKYINIFPKNINIMAIVGKNGTGKSSIFKAFLEEIYRREEKNEYKNIKQYSEISANDFVTVYWDYSVTDEAFLEYEPDAKHCIYKKNRTYITLPAKVDNANDANIDLHKDIQNLARNILNIDDMNSIIKDFFEIDKILILIKKDIFEDRYEMVRNKNYIEDIYGEDIREKESIYELSYSKENIKLINSNLSKIRMLDFISKDGKKLLFLSFGEIQLLKILCNIQSLINDITNDNRNVLFLLDELELGLHPQWQKMIINLLSKVIIKNEKKVFLVLTSHSPFILSDLPKENIIFLDRDEQTGNCINASDKVDINPFGANIHTLLSHGFFMKDGLMGEFAKEKINQVYNFIVQNDTNFIKTKEEAQNIINLIGEPLIKKQLQKLFDETFDKNNLTLDDEIELLEKKLNALKELKNDKN